MTSAEAPNELSKVTGWFKLLPEDSGVFPQWRTMVQQHGVLGKAAHDARLAATMLVHHVTHVLTLNATDFLRYKAITVLKPDAVLATP